MTEQEAIRHLRTWPWQEHVQQKQDLEAMGDEACPPSMSFARGDRMIFVMLEGDAGFDLMISAAKTTRRFGLFPSTGTTDWEAHGIPLDDVEKFVKALFGDDDQAFHDFVSEHSDTKY